MITYTLGQEHYQPHFVCTLQIKATNVGELKKIAIRHDNAGLSPDWHCSQVRVHGVLLAFHFCLTAHGL